MKKCPKCNGDLIEIVYGMPGSELAEAEERGEVILGGCCVLEDGPEYHCRNCNLEFSHDLKKTFKPDYEEE